jgi:hypothetical protein
VTATSFRRSCCYIVAVITAPLDLHGRPVVSLYTDEDLANAIAQADQTSFTPSFDGSIADLPSWRVLLANERLRRHDLLALGLAQPV